MDFKIKSNGNSFQVTPLRNFPQEAVKYDEDENERGNWSGRFDFILSAIGFAVGLGNVWRFPYQAFQHGGASFLIPYMVMLGLAGLPLFFMEMALGQFSSLGPISVWNAMPIFRGLGYAMVMISLMCSIYYNMIIAYTLYYFFISIRATLPWQKCEQSWIDNYGCRDREALNATQRNITDMLCKAMEVKNETGSAEYADLCDRKTPSEVYWDRVVLDVSGSIDEGSSDIKWHLALCLLLAWTVIFFCLIKGIKSSGKVVYVTATFPYVVLIILFIRNVTLEGAIEGIKFYVIPEWDKLYNIKAWHAAATQIFYSLGVAFGGLETMASYNRFKNNVYRDVLIVAILNCLTSVFAGFVIFSVMGFMSVRTGIPVEKVVSSGK
ncbi:hypothetical protein NP493_1600g00028 [Ridgeia piscesae]|uniref:Transporter n=1 Tax=Ridgeia piscesae TaxID=27915 RepID=A0AAD9JXD0_RIDPI|nr:hypothetical protein NP493_1600g00028 [Ridgeia piscesae]